VGFRIRRARVLVGAAAGLAAMAGSVGMAGSAGAASSASPQISGNWAGYAASGSNITSVTGTWTVPAAGTLPPGVSSTWVGIGGFTTSDLIQAGTQQVSSPLDQVFAGGAYGAWYEMLPDNPVFITGCAGDAKCTVNPGDAMNVTVANQGGNSWKISMADGSHWSWSGTFNYVSTESSAEWIHEAPSLAGALPIPVGNSGTVTFDGAANSAVIGNATRSIGASGAVPVEALPVETTTSALDSDGDGFNVCTYSLSCAAPAS
jgi:hypothetical protein